MKAFMTRACAKRTEQSEWCNISTLLQNTSTKFCLVFPLKPNLESEWLMFAGHMLHDSTGEHSSQKPICLDHFKGKKCHLLISAPCFPLWLLCEYCECLSTHSYFKSGTLICYNSKMESVSNEHPNHFVISHTFNWVTQGRSRVVIYLMMTSV